MSLEPTMHITYALLNPETAFAAAGAFRGDCGKAAVEGLIELVYAPRTAKEAGAAVAALEGCDDAIIWDALAAALDSPHASIRIAAIQSLHRRGAADVGGKLARLLGRDESWQVRRAALDALADGPPPGRWQVLDALDDPHWRVRHALVRALLRWGDAEARRGEIDDRIAATNRSPRARGVRDYLRWRWAGRSPGDFPTSDAPDPAHVCSFWDWDPAVLVRNLERMGEGGRRQAIDIMPFLLGHDEERVRASAAEALRRWGGPGHLAVALAILDDPRTGAGESVARLLASLDLDRTEAAARYVLRLPAATPAPLAWALDQAGVAFPLEEEETLLRGLLSQPAGRPAAVRAALARLAGQWPHADADAWLRSLLDDAEADVALEALRGVNGRPALRLDEAVLRRLLHSPSAALRAGAVQTAIRQGCDEAVVAPLADDADAAVRACLAECVVGREEAWAASLLARLQGDPHPHVRAAAQTPARAAELVADPARETSWRVLTKAARMQRVPLWKLAPEPPWRPDPATRAAPPPLRPTWAPPPHARVLGPERWAVAPVGVSGHYGLPVEGFVRAAEAGVNVMFWEPNYRTLTEFFTRLSAADRGAVRLIAGTFEADGVRVRRDAERVLRTLKLERVPLFLLFWVRSWARVADDVRATLERLKEEGKIASFGLSTHSRPLAVEAMGAGGDPVMVRHSAAHRGAETHVFPRAAELGASVITFNATCYGRLLAPRGDGPSPGAADCYRYTLAQPGVRCCLSAPATLAQLDENLAALRDPALPEDRRKRLEAHGAAVYEEETTFRKLVRSV
jgi:HEAT repeat protein